MFEALSLLIVAVAVTAYWFPIRRWFMRGERRRSIARVSCAATASSILPEFQHLAVGVEIPIGHGCGFPVTAIEPGRELVMSGSGDGFRSSWRRRF